jgi:hypothetical protein
MNKHLTAFICYLFFLLCNTGYAQITVNYSSSSTAGGLGQFSSGSNWSTSGGYTFEVGVFNSGFTPTSGNVSSWSTSWTIATDNVSNFGTTTWINDNGATYFQATGAYLNNSSPFTTSPATQLYVWGYNTKTIGSGTEWILLGNTNWLVQNASSASTYFIDSTDIGTYAVVGVVSNNGINLMSSAIPEPSAYAAALGIISLGLCAIRRRRKA